MATHDSLIPDLFWGNKQHFVTFGAIVPDVQIIRHPTNQCILILWVIHHVANGEYPRFFLFGYLSHLPSPPL